MRYSLSNDTWDAAEIEAAHKVIDSRYFTMGANVKQYEKDFAEKFGAKYAVMSNSGSSANLLTMASLLYSGRLNRGDEVLVTAVSWSTTYFPISQMGFKLRFVDINLDTLNVDVDALEAAITPATKAVMLVNLLGNPNEFDRIQKICDGHGLIMLEDNCESMGATFNGKCAGTFGLIGSFSTYFSHHLCTMEGGVNVTDDEELYHYMLSIRSHGWTRHLPDDSPIYKKSGDPFYESFNFIMPGFNVRPLEIEAATGIEQLKKLNPFIEQRRKNAELFKKRISEETSFLTQKEIGTASWFGFAIILPEEIKGKRDAFTDALRAAEIEVRPIVAGNFARQKALKFLDYSISGELKNADYIHDNGFFVGNHSIEMGESINLLIDVLKSVCRGGTTD
ncbi:MAG: DegT/DnrJ/EryC1/StrS family aminotransferase [Eubacterium sp.]|nr:DegT/DnrJ/EryC1/StrS family aminotransferase [Eubacterium sp.]